MSDYKVCEWCDHPALDWNLCCLCQEPILPCGCNLGVSAQEGNICLGCHEDAQAVRGAK